MLLNRARAVQKMRDASIDALVATSPVSITYVTDYHCWLDTLFKDFMSKPGGSDALPQNYALLPVEGEPALVVPALLAANVADLWVEDLHPFGDAALDAGLRPEKLDAAAERLYRRLSQSEKNHTALEALVSAVEKRGLATSRIGVEMAGLPSAQKRALCQALPRARFVDCTQLLRLVRMVKSAEEIVRLERAAAISEKAAMEALQLLGPGRLMGEAIAHYRRRVAELGAEFDHFAFGYSGLGIAMEPECVLEENDVLYVDFGCVFEHYFSDSGTTLALGELTEPLAERFGALRECIASGWEAIRPGVRSSAVHAAMQAVQRARGIAASSPHGHGLGLEIRDYPILVADNELRLRDDCVDVQSDLPLEADMVINLEASLFLAGVASLQIEKSFVVTDDGARELIPHDRSRPVRVG